MDGPEPERTLRLARVDDVPELDELMKASIRDIFPAFYDEQQTASSVVHVAVPDEMLIADGTYFVIDEPAPASWPAAAGAAATSSTPGRAQARHARRLIHRRSLHASEPCSSAPTERGAVSGRGSSTRASQRPMRRAFARWR